MRAKDSQTSTVLRVSPASAPAPAPALWLTSPPVLAMLPTQSILSEQQYAAKQSGGTPATLSSLLQKAVARRREAATQFRQGQRDDLAEKEEEEAVILERFLPRQMSVEEVEAVAKQALAELGDVDGKKKLGALIKAVNARVDRSAAPGAIVSKACANVLA